MINNLIIVFAAIFAFCVLLSFALLCLISYTILHDKIIDIYYEIKSWFKEKRE